jgi:hypothetical protein
MLGVSGKVKDKSQIILADAKISDFSAAEQDEFADFLKEKAG